MSATDTVVKDETKIKKPKRYHVLLLNDDYTSFEFVITILIQIFKHDQFSAIALTDMIHKQGKGIAGTYTYEIAEQKATDTIALAKTNGYPLQAVLEEE
jgi:ATP-dependent Clp protease adaptor protein ClpS